MSQSNGSGRRRPKVLSPESKWEIFLQVTTGEATQADLARKWGVDVSTIITIRRTVKEAALAALSAKPDRPAKERDWRLEAARAEIAELSMAVKSRMSRLNDGRPQGGEAPIGPRPIVRTAQDSGAGDLEHWQAQMTSDFGADDSEHRQ